ncbi:MAG: hypothetical protein M5R36_20140 [Deltaproteobacteria bacterium]|nr:hypothetical protein [Deltaproteobacteria bacterium]
MTTKAQTRSRREPLSRLVAAYEKLTPPEKARIRQEILRRAGRDEAQRMRDELKRAEAAQALAAPAPEHFDPISEELGQYLRDARKALSHYFPFDRYRAGDENNLELLRLEVLHMLEPLEWLLKTYFRYEVKGLEHVPLEGRSMIVSNHGLLPIDGAFLYYEILRHRKR